MNILCLTGNLGRDAELRRTQNGDAVASFSVAMKSGWGDKAVTSWVNCSMWGKRAEAVVGFLVKGQLVGVTGELTLDKWQGNDGVEKQSLKLRVNEVTLLGKADNSERDYENGEAEQRHDSSLADDLDDSIPF
jgi:single-strand DNA-binding protein